jgi:peptidoglycan/xylan/chitin deacetylase (PgdA/CDA1 family)
VQERARDNGRLLAILAYHKIGDAPRGAWEPWNYVPEAMLAEQLVGLREAGWAFVNAKTVMHGLADPAALQDRSVLVTFDDGYRSLLESGLPVLLELGCPAVVFVPAAYVGDVSSFDSGLSEPFEPLCDWQELRELEGAGVSVQSHGLRHVRLSRVGPAELEAEITHSKALLEERLQKAVELFAFAYGDPGREAARVGRLLEQSGYGAACLYGGGAFELPAADRYALTRLAVGFGTDIVGEIGAPPRTDAEIA